MVVEFASNLNSNIAEWIKSHVALVYFFANYFVSLFTWSYLYYLLCSFVCWFISLFLCLSIRFLLVSSFTFFLLFAWFSLIIIFMFNASINFRAPCTMVDRITTQTASEHREILAKDFGVVDRWPVVTEDYKQWIIEV